ncbi:hypothetical protein ACFYU5_08195 [Nocardia aobensis]|uniref:Tyr recombinase domain-containing protein n=1 Tax=Nocardia aobensis TaxID=257277 RepID=A0ABW6NYW0_9NOCA
MSPLGCRAAEVRDRRLALTGLDLADWPGALAITDSSGGTRIVPLQPGTRAALVAWLAERRRLLRGHPEQIALFLVGELGHLRVAFSPA